MRYGQRGFVGRQDEMAELASLLNDPAVKVVCITGETGVGKTALASRIYEHAASQRFERRVKHSAFRAGQWERLEDWLMVSLAKELLPTFIPNATRVELESGILTYVAKHNILLLVDNAESLDRNWLLSFVNKWLKTANGSKLILTTTEELLLNGGTEVGYRRYQLDGFRTEEEQAILSLLGEELQDRYQRGQLLEAAAKLRNNPQRLLYLRWLNPQNEKELNGIVQRLSADEPVMDLGDVIKSRIEGPIVPFLALGHVRGLEIDETLLDWLWDRLVGGSAETYREVCDQLVAEGFLSRAGELGSKVMYVHPGVHIQLEKHLEHHVGLANISHVDYYLSLYYRHEFEGRPSAPDVALLYEYVSHAIRARDLLAASDFVLTPERLVFLHGMGLALGLSRVFALLAEEIETQRRAVPKGSREAKTLAGLVTAVRIELAHCWCDLSEYERCLDTLDQAESTLSELPERKSVRHLRQNIYYLRGISLGCLGRSLDSMGAYLRVVKDGIKRGQIGRLAIEALGYVALNLSFHDMGRARSLGRKALELANEHGESILIAKNKCSVGQILFFAGEIDEATALFDDAENLCRPSQNVMGDRRELARVLVPKSMVYIVNKEYAKAMEMLEEAENMHSETGDRRRLGRTKLLKGICLWRNGQTEEGQTLIEEAIRQHYQIGDWLSLVLEALTHGFMLRFVRTSQTLRNAALPQYREQAWAKILTDPAGQDFLELYGGYWESYFKSRLLEQE